MILYSDLDGCFLDIDTYSYDDTIKYAQKFIDSGNILIFCSSKTYDEIGIAKIPSSPLGLSISELYGMNLGIAHR